MRSSRRHTTREVGSLAAAVKWAQDMGYTANDLPRGRRHSADECPLAKATGCLVASGQYAEPGEGSLDWQPLRSSVVDFVDLFDRGRYPELELR